MDQASDYRRRAYHGPRTTDNGPRAAQAAEALRPITLSSAGGRGASVTCLFRSARALLHLPHILTHTATLTTAAVLACVAMAAIARRCFLAVLRRAFLAGLAAGGIQKLTGSRKAFVAGVAVGAVLGGRGRPILRAIGPLLPLPGKAQLEGPK